MIYSKYSQIPRNNSHDHNIHSQFVYEKWEQHHSVEECRHHYSCLNMVTPFSRFNYIMRTFLSNYHVGWGLWASWLHFIDASYNIQQFCWCPYSRRNRIIQSICGTLHNARYSNGRLSLAAFAHHIVLNGLRKFPIQQSFCSLLCMSSLYRCPCLKIWFIVVCPSLYTQPIQILFLVLCLTK